jgi:folate-binding protein YgfZ
MGEAVERTEAVEQTIERSPLDESHARRDALMAVRDGWRLPASYGDASAEYQTVRSSDGAGLIDLSSRGLIEVSGAEAVQFLNGLVTNDVKALADGAWMTAAFPNVQGRLLAYARVLRRKDSYLFDTEAVTRERVFQTLARFTLAGDFHVNDRTHERALLSLQGACASRIVTATLGEDAARVAHGRLVETNWNNKSITLIRATHTSEDGYDIFIGAEDSNALWDALLEAGARPTGFDALEVLRIEAGLPRYGVDMDETRVVLETGLDDAVSFTKGCYVGQEIIARIHWRGHVAKRLAGLSFDDKVEVERDAKIKTTDGKDVGQITSLTFSPRLQKTIALAYVRYDYLAPGTELRVLSGGEERTARVTELPFVRGSWHKPSMEVAPPDEQRV